MDKIFEGEGDIRDLFKQMLGSDIIIKDNISENEEKLFILIVEQLEKSKKLEDKTMELGFEFKPLVDPLWIVIENMLKLQFGLDTTELIMFYLYDRIGPDGKIKDLFSYIKFRYPDK